MKNRKFTMDQNLQSRMTEHEFEFDPQAWNDMNTMLNKHYPRRSPLWISSLIMLTIAITFLSVAWYVPIQPIQSFIEETFDIQQILEEEPIIEEQNAPSTITPFLSPDENGEIEESHPFEKMVPMDNENTPDHINKLDKTNFVSPIASLETTLESEQEEMEMASVYLPKKKKVTAGFFGGGSVAMSGSPLIPAGAVSPSIGVFAGYHINDKWSIQGEVNFRKGFIQPFTPKDDRTEFLNLPPLSSESTPYDRVAANQNIIARNLTVLEFPILAKYNLNETHSVMAGVRPSWIHVKDPNSDNSNSDTQRSAIYEKLDVGVSIGYELQLSKRVAVNLRYNQGVTDLFQENEETYLNNDFQASVRYTLNP